LLFPVPEDDIDPYKAEVMSFLPEEILSRSIRHQDTREYSWDYQTTLEILDICEAKDIVIIGGDIIKSNGFFLSYEGSSWDIESNKFNTENSLARYSIQFTREYLKKYPDPRDGTIRYLLVFHPMLL
jgi:hypothetical protein